ncbi:gamma-glutamyltransferase family protein [Dethiosulfovibrio sp. F2B]|uniref:gamma-glutamyltransferase family protein n=1 Tax=Dethiosulfovibrio faecalis TaxID=2720018 RepID=UPI001F29E16F|nr:gamma-glutamyltransferase family protein [Dethiosulfovibrio faecalis]MCF4151087.1 gamma-glutamyltransferase family protein [Dethiosulfovibrio faecalis]
MKAFDPQRYRYPSRRALVYGSRGMVATSHPQAAQAGLDTLKKGGNAVDAAIATAAALTVVEPTSNGLGSDAFAIICKDGRLYGINGSGPSPKTLTRDLLNKKGLSRLPSMGWLPVCVPGAVATWAAMSKRMGRLPLSEVLAPAVDLAKQGVAVPPTVSKNWNLALDKYGTSGDPALSPWKDTFVFDGKTPEPGDIVRLVHHGKTLELIARSDGRDLYQGELADRIVSFASETGGLLAFEDLVEYTPEWVEPLSVDYGGLTAWELPPNGQGMVALMALGILNGPEPSDPNSPESVHRSIEALKLAFADGHRYICDPHMADVPVDRLLSDGYLAERSRLLGDRAARPEPGDPNSGGTVYLATADGFGNMVSMIQSNYTGFGSGVVVPGTGIALNNRGLGFSMEPGHPNEIMPGKRPYHTIIPGFLTKGGEPLGPFGVMGGYMQPQGHLQVITNLVRRGMNPQEALDAPRWQWTGGLDVSVEQSFPSDMARALSRMGHHITVVLEPDSFGRGQIILKTDKGSLVGATEPRADGTVATW